MPIHVEQTRIFLREEWECQIVLDNERNRDGSCDPLDALIRLKKSKSCSADFLRTAGGGQN